MIGQKTVLLLLVCCLPVSLSAECILAGSLDWNLGIRGGVEYRFNRVLGLKADIGVVMLQVPALDVFCILYLLQPQKSLRLNLLLGMPNLLLHFDFEPIQVYTMVSFGGSLVLGYWFNNRIGLDLRVGGSLPLFFGEEDKPMIRPLNFSLFEDTILRYMWPDLTLTLNFRR